MEVGLDTRLLLAVMVPITRLEGLVASEGLREILEVELGVPSDIDELEKFLKYGDFGEVLVCLMVELSKHLQEFLEVHEPNPEVVPLNRRKCPLVKASFGNIM